jgi:hypothetical protein
VAVTFTDTTNAAGPTFAGRPATQTAGGAPKLNLPTNAQWWYIWHPSRWQCIDGEWLPVLAQMRATPGVNAVDKDGDTSGAETKLRREHWTVIPWDVIEGGYVTEYDGVRGPVRLSRWETPRMVAGQVVITPDEAGYREFLRGLVSSGVVRAPDPYTTDAIKERQRFRVAENSKRAANDPEAARRLEADKALLAQMDSAKVPTAQSRKGRA